MLQKSNKCHPQLYTLRASAGERTRGMLVRYWWGAIYDIARFENTRGYDNILQAR